MLIPVEATPISVRFSLRINKGLKKAVEWFSKRENRSENETIIQFLHEKIKDYCNSESIAFIVWSSESSDFIEYVKKLEKDKEELEGQKAIKPRPKNPDAPSRTIVFQTRTWSEVNDVFKLPLKLFLSLCLHGIDPYSLLPGIYEYNDPFFSDLKKHVEKNLPLIKRKIPSAYSLHDLVKVEDEEDLEILSLFGSEDEIQDDDLPF